MCFNVFCTSYVFNMTGVYCTIRTYHYFNGKINFTAYRLYSVVYSQFLIKFSGIPEHIDGEVGSYYDVPLAEKKLAWPWMCVRSCVCEFPS